MFEYRIDFYQNLLTVTILIISLFIIGIAGIRTKKDTLIVLGTFLWHTLFSIVYFLYSLNNVADAKGYYKTSITDTAFSFYPGGRFINYLTSIFSQGIDANYLNSALIFNLFGSIGLVFLYLSIKRYLSTLSWNWALILFIPSMSFWSSGLGKDSISFMAACLFLYAVSTSKSALLPLIIAFTSMFMVRPHVAAMFLISYAIYFVIKSRVHIVLKLIILPAISIALLLSIGFVQEYIGLEDASIDGVSDYIDGRQSVNLSGGSSLDIASMSYPMQIFTYIFRPLPFEAHSAMALITSLENSALLLIFLYIFIKSKSSLRTFIKDENLWLFTYTFLTCTILALTTANLGIANRQKWMFMPVLIYLLIYALHDYKTKRNKAYL